MAIDYETICNGPKGFIGFMFDLSGHLPSARREPPEKRVEKSTKLDNKCTTKISTITAHGLSYEGTTYRNLSRTIKNEPQLKSLSNSQVNFIKIKLLHNKQ